MAFSTKWLIPQMILLVDLSGKIAAPEVQDVIDHLYEITSAEDAPETVHLLIDLRGTTTGASVFDYLRVRIKRGNHSGYTILIGNSQVVGKAFMFFSGIARMNCHHFHTPEEALDFLKETDEAVRAYLESDDTSDLFAV